MEDEDLRVEVRDLDHERVKEVVGVAAGVEVALELGNVPEEKEVLLDYIIHPSIHWQQHKDSFTSLPNFHSHPS